MVARIFSFPFLPSNQRGKVARNPLPRLQSHYPTCDFSYRCRPHPSRRRQGFRLIRRPGAPGGAVCPHTTGKFIRRDRSTSSDSCSDGTNTSHHDGLSSEPDSDSFVGSFSDRLRERAIARVNYSASRPARHCTGGAAQIFRLRAAWEPGPAPPPCERTVHVPQGMNNFNRSTLPLSPYPNHRTSIPAGI